MLLREAIPIQWKLSLDVELISILSTRYVEVS